MIGKFGGLLVLIATITKFPCTDGFSFERISSGNLVSSNGSFLQSRTFYYDTKSTKATTSLFLARSTNTRGGKNNNKGNKSKLKGRNNKTVSSNKTSSKKSSKKSSPGSSSGSNKKVTVASAATLSSSGKQAPPWKVMSTKDAKKNIELEKERRRLIQTGEAPSSIEMASSTVIRADSKSSLLTPLERTLYNWKRFKPDASKMGGLSFIGAYLDKRLPPSLGVPEVAFLGRSNVGKSSLLNCLVSHTRSGGDTARVGKTPGATASVNLYALYQQNTNKNYNNADTNNNNDNNNKALLGFADLPGFGYAKLSKEMKQSVELAAERYLGKRKELALGILLVDIRRVPSNDDRAVLAALYDLGLPILVVATKIDKISSSRELDQQKIIIQEGLGLPEGQPFCVSSATGQGKNQLWQIILDACEDRVVELRNQAENKPNENDDEFYHDQYIMEDEDEIEYDQGYDWIQSFGSDEYMDDDEEEEEDWKTMDSNQKMKENQEMQAAEKEAMQLKNLRKRTKEMEKRGEL